MRALVRFFFSPEAAVFLPASFFSGALEAVAGALEAAGFLSAALGGILIVCWLRGENRSCDGWVANARVVGGCYGSVWWVVSV